MSASILMRTERLGCCFIEKNRFIKTFCLILPNTVTPCYPSGLRERENHRDYTFNSFSLLWEKLVIKVSPASQVCLWPFLIKCHLEFVCFLYKDDSYLGSQGRWPHSQKSRTRRLSSVLNIKGLVDYMKNDPCKWSHKLNCKIWEIMWSLLPEALQIIIKTSLTTLNAKPEWNVGIFYFFFI